MTLRADCYPAGLEPAGPTTTVADTPDGAIRATRLDAASAAALAAGLRERSSAFRRLDAELVQKELAEAHGEMLDSIIRMEEPALGQIAAVTRYPEIAVGAGLIELFGRLDGRGMRGWLKEAGIAVSAQDPVPRTTSARRVLGPGLTVVIASGNIPGAALPSVVQALLLKSPVLVKCARAEPLLAATYARRLNGRLASRYLAVVWWEGGDAAVEEAIARHADAVVVYGNDETVAAWARRSPPPRRLVAYGHRASIAAIARERLVHPRIARLASDLARDIARYDQQGCLSPQVIYVETGGAGEPELLVPLLAKELEKLADWLPPRPLTAGEAAALHQYRTVLEMRSLRDPAVRISHGGSDATWTVAVDPHAAPGAVPLGRTAAIRPLASLEELPALLAPYRDRLGGACLAAPPERAPRLIELLVGAGVGRVVRPGRAHNLVAPGLHDGVNALAVLARYVAVEAGY